MGRFPLVDCFHACAVAHEYRKGASAKQGSLQRLFAIVITSLGGTTMMNLLNGQPMGWSCDNQTLPAYVVAWLLLHHAPGDVVFRAIESSDSTRFLVGFLDDISWGVAITKWGMFNVIHAAHPNPRGSAVAAILGGWIAGCGGGIIQQACSLLDAEWSLTTPDALTGPILSLKSGFGVKASAFMSALAYGLLDPHGILRSLGGQAVDLDADGVAVTMWCSKPQVVFTAVVVMVSGATVRSTVKKLLA